MALYRMKSNLVRLHYITVLPIGLQEYIEALSFYHYLKYKKLILLGEVVKRLEFTPTNKVNCCWNQ